MAVSYEAHTHDELDRQIMIIDPVGLVALTDSIDKQIEKAEKDIHEGNYEEAERRYQKILAGKEPYEGVLKERPDGFFYIMMQRYCIYNNLALAEWTLGHRKELPKHLARALFYEIFDTMPAFQTSKNVEAFEEKETPYLSSWNLIKTIYPRANGIEPYTLFPYDTFDKIVSNHILKNLEHISPLSLSFFMIVLVDHLRYVRMIGEYHYWKADDMIDETLDYIEKNKKGLSEDFYVIKRSMELLCKSFSYTASPGSFESAIMLADTTLNRLAGVSEPEEKVHGFSIARVAMFPEQAKRFIDQLYVQLLELCDQGHIPDEEVDKVQSQLNFVQEKLEAARKENDRLERQLHDTQVQLKQERTSHATDMASYQQRLSEYAQLKQSIHMKDEKEAELKLQIGKEKNKREKEKKIATKMAHQQEQVILQLKEEISMQAEDIKKLKAEISGYASSDIKLKDELWELKNELRDLKRNSVRKS